LVRYDFNRLAVYPSFRTYITHTQQQQQPFNGRLSGTTRVGRYQKKHSPTHTHLLISNILHNFWTSTHRGEASPLPPSGGVTGTSDDDADRLRSRRVQSVVSVATILGRIVHQGSSDVQRVIVGVDGEAGVRGRVDGQAVTAPLYDEVRQLARVCLYVAR